MAYRQLSSGSAVQRGRQPERLEADSRAKRNGSSEADLHVPAKLFEQRLERGEEAEALPGRQVVAQHDLLQLGVAERASRSRSRGRSRRSRPFAFSTAPFCQDA